MMTVLYSEKENEFQKLVADMQPLGFKKSKELSQYIFSHNLIKNYPNLCGDITMQKDGTSWGFHGGFSPEIYGRLCEALSLENEGSKAQVVGFKSYKNL